ncbi:MAG: hypothetical protein ACD_56C00138G0002 [uncultured bacterium]|nr:MAG: hypothetical protein ACD_56C00138G0002 [uncultured bacterium]
MRCWVVKDENKVHFKFQPDNPEESRVLDDLLNFNWKQENFPISNDRDKKVSDGATQTAILHGHESERTISVKL